MHLETARLTIRPWSHDEADRLLDIQSRMEVVKWLSDGDPVLMKHLDQAHERIEASGADGPAAAARLSRRRAPAVAWWRRALRAG